MKTLRVQTQSPSKFNSLIFNRLEATSNLSQDRTLLKFLKFISFIFVLCIVKPLDAQDGFILVCGPGNSSVFQGYCDPIPFTIQITNEGNASAFDVRISPEDIEFDYTDFGNLPDNEPEIQGDQDVIEFETPVLIDAQSISYHFSMLATTWATGNTYSFIVKVTKKSNTSFGTHLYDLQPFENRNVNLNSYIYASDIIDDHFLNPSLIPLSGVSLPACNNGSTQRLYIPDKIIFDIPDYCIYNAAGTGTLVMGAGSELIIENGSTLTINDTRVGSCDQMWKGIYVKKGGRLILNNCQIENAQYGIRAERGAQVASYETTFKNNYIGLYISPYIYQSDPEEPDDSYVLIEAFYNNLFIGEGEMLPPYTGQTPTPESRPYAGIKASYLSHFDLPGYVGANDFSNYFENLSNGILLDHSPLRMGDAFFKNISFDPEINASLQGYGINITEGKYTEIKGNSSGVAPPDYDYHFENCDVGVYNSKGSVDISGMTMGHVKTGIELVNIKNGRISIADNTINATDLGVVINQCVPTDGDILNNFIEVIGNGDASSCIEINDPPVPTLWNVENNYISVAEARYGILNRSGSQNAFMNNTIIVQPYTEDDAFGLYLEGVKGLMATCNSLTGDIEPSVNNYHNSAGIFFEGNNSFDISCNDINDFRYGIKVSSQNTGQGLLRGNIFGDQWQGLLLGRTAVIGPQEHHGNIWDATYYDFAAVHEGSSQLVDQSPFYYDINDNTYFEPSSISAATSWFYNRLGSSFICNEEETCPEGVGYINPLVNWDSLDLEVIAGNLGFDYFDNSLSWMSRFHTYRRLKDLSSTLLPSQINTFLSNQQSLNIGKFSNAFDSLAVSLRYQGPLSGILEAYPEDMSGFYSRILHWDTLIMANRGIDTLIDRLRLVYDSIYVLECNYLSKKGMINNILVQHIDNAIDYTEGISPDSIWEEKLQFTLLEHLVFAKYDTLTSSVLLQELANACSDMYGDPVYHARSLVRVDSSGKFYDHEGLCNYLSPRGIMDPIALSITIQPNPAFEYINILSSDQFQEIRFYDLTGKMITIPYSQDCNRVFCNISSMPPGMYIVQATDDQLRTVSEKLIVVRK